MAGGTPASTPERTEDSEEEYLPPCREANLFVAPCPRCGRQLKLKTLRYSHVCGRTFNVEQRAAEQWMAAQKALTARMRAVEQTREQRVEPTERPAERGLEQRRDFSKLISF